jgi:hypothetical protein
VVIGVSGDHPAQGDLIDGHRDGGKRLLEKSFGHILMQQKVNKPDRKAVERKATELNGEIENFNQEIAKLDKRIEDIKKQIETANEARSGVQVWQSACSITPDNCPIGWLTSAMLWAGRGDEGAREDGSPQEAAR